MPHIHTLRPVHTFSRPHFCTGGKIDAAALTVEDAEHVAKAIAHTAHTYAQNPYRKTPWSVSAAETGMPWARFFVKVRVQECGVCEMEMGVPLARFFDQVWMQECGV